MKIIIRLSEIEYELLQCFKDCLNSNSFFLKIFQEKDVPDLIIHYLSKKNSSDKKSIAQMGFHFVNGNNYSVENPFFKVLLDIGIYDFLKKRTESKAIILDKKSEEEVKKLNEYIPNETFSSLIKSALFGIITDPYEVANIMIGFLFSYTFLFVSSENIGNSYSFESAKKDYIEGKLPSLHVKESDFYKYSSMFKIIESFDSFEKVLEYARIPEMPQNEIIRRLKYGVEPISTTEQTEQKLLSARTLNAYSQEILAITPSVILARKLISTAFIYANLEDGNLPVMASSIIDNVVDMLFFGKDKNIGVNMEKINNDFNDLLPIIKMHMDEWKEHIEQLKKDD